MKVTTPVFMGVVYFVVITPIGLLRRALVRGRVELADELCLTGQHGPDWVGAAVDAVLQSSATSRPRA